MDFRIDILLQANDFYEAYERCLEGKNIFAIGTTARAHIVSVPAIVNAAFACELYLKSLLGKELVSHNLMGFYRKLPPEIKNELRSAYRLQKAFGFSSFEEAIGAVKNTFVEWRYLYKEKNKSQSNPKDLNDFLNIFSIIVPILKKTAQAHCPPSSKI